jgi:hypothetical protein
MRWSILPALALAVLLAIPPVATAATLSKTAMAGKTTKIDEYTGWNNDCSFLTISVDVSSPPSHGTVTSKVARGRITNAAVGSAGRCFGRPTRVLQVYYRAKPGFRGTDTFAVDMTVRGQPTKTFTYSVSVR